MKYLSFIVRAIKSVLVQLKNYPNMPASERPDFWRKMQALFFLALLPLFLMLGVVSRLFDRIRGTDSA